MTDEENFHDIKHDWNKVEAYLDRKYGTLHEYGCVVIEASGPTEQAPIFGRDDAEALKTFDAMVMQWHNNRRLMPTSLFEHHVYPNALELVLVRPDGSEVTRFELVHPTAR